MSDLAPETPPTTPPTFTLGEAAKAAGVSKPTLSKAIHSGRLSAEKNPDGSYTIQAAELFRVYPPDSKGNESTHDDIDEPETGKDNRFLAGEVSRLREQLATVNTERERERQQLSDQIADLRRRLDADSEERRKLTAVLLDQRPKPEPDAAPVKAAEAPAPRRLWGLFRRG